MLQEHIYQINAAIWNFLKESQRVYNSLIQFKQNILILQLFLKGQVTLKADFFQKHNLTDPRIFKDIICTLICILAFLRGKNLFWMAWSYALSVICSCDDQFSWILRWGNECINLWDDFYIVLSFYYTAYLYFIFLFFFFFCRLFSCRASLMTIRTETSKGNVSIRTSWWVNTPCFCCLLIVSDSWNLSFF